MTVEASAANESGGLEAALASQALRHSAGVALAALVIGVLSTRLDPTSASTPLIAANGRAYYLLALAVTVVTTVAIAGFNLDLRALLHSSEPGASVLALGAATLLFVSHRSTGEIVLVTALSGGFIYAAHASRLAPPGSISHRAVAVATIVLLTLFVAALFEYRMRTLYAAPVVALAAGLAFLQLRTGERESTAWIAGPLVAAVVSSEMILALGFLNINTWLAAAIWMAAFLATVAGFSDAAAERLP